MNLARKYSRIVDEVFGLDPGTDEPLVREAGSQVARGDSLVDADDGAQLTSQLPDVPDDAWTQFVRAMIVAPLSSVSASNGLGLFDMTPRRLADLGIVRKLERSKSPTSGRTIWIAVFVRPLTCYQFLRSPTIQYGVFSSSNRDYAKKIANGEIEKSPETSLSGALAILHRAGPKGLEGWKRGQRFPTTILGHDKVSGLF